VQPTIQLGPFDLVGPINRGAMGEVWRGRHRKQDVPVAVKVLTREQARIPDFVAALRQEVRAAATLDHEGVVMVLDYGEVDEGLPFPVGSPYVVMELCSGGTLVDLALPLPWHEVRYILLRLLDALAHAHARGVIHRDIKPANVLLATGQDLRPGLKLTDFGIAHLAHERERAGSAEDGRGTPIYAAPEQLLGQFRDYGPWTDIYALGCVAWQMLTRRPPFVGRSYGELVRAHSEADLPRFEPVHEVPEGVENWLRRALSKAPLSRFRRAAEAAWMLRGLGGEVVVETPEFLRRVSVARHAPFTAIAPATTVQLDHTHTQVDAMPRGGQVSDGRIFLDRARPPFPDEWRAARSPAAPLRLIGAGLELHGLRRIPFVDREATRSALWALFGEVHRTAGVRAVIIEGAAGVGKTRLATWLQERAHELGLAATMRATHSSPGSVGDGLGPMVARHAGLMGLTGAQLEARCARLAGMFGMEQELVWRGFADIVFPGQQDTARDAHWRLAALHLYVMWIGMARPTVVVLDDVQWGLEAIEFAHHVLTERTELSGGDTRSLFVLVVQEEALATRPAEAAALAALATHASVKRVRVEPLPADAQRELCWRGLQLTPGLATRVARRSEGSPYFAIQLVDDWIQRGLLTSSEEGFGLTTDSVGDDTETVHHLWARQVERVVERGGPGVRPALEIAALLGLHVHLEEWRGACSELGVELSPSLLHVMFATRLALPTDDGLRFAHAMLRDVLVTSCLDRVRYERAIVSMLLARYPFPSDELLERMARHERFGATT
jgi:eukaryotic-like serine/threonine-protein kinase